MSEQKPPQPAPFGYCPWCFEPGIKRDSYRQLDTCEFGHVYPSGKALQRYDQVPDRPAEKESGG